MVIKQPSRNHQTTKKGKRMKNVILALVLGTTLVLASGCPELGIENPVDEGNALVVHNQYDWVDDQGVVHEVECNFLSVVMVSDECSEDRPCGINLLPSPMEFGDSFEVTGLGDGKYYCQIGSGCASSAAKTGYVTLSGGNTTDWYVR